MTRWFINQESQTLCFFCVSTTSPCPRGIKAGVLLVVIFLSRFHGDSVTKFSALWMVVLLLVQPPQGRSETQVQNYVCMNSR